ncbi:MAG: hypothetical protein WAR80_11260 [Ferruginibacter sp.]
MKNSFLFYFLFILTLFISANSFCQTANENNIKRIAKSFVEFQYDSLKYLNTKEHILFIGVNSIDKDSMYMSICFLSTYNLKDVKYDKLYEFNGFKLVITDEMDKSYILKRLFKETAYENINKSNYRLSLHPKEWHVTLNNKYEVVSVESQFRFRDVVRILKKNKVKLASNFHFIQNMSWQTDDR